MKILNAFLQRYASPLYTFPFNINVPSNGNSFAASTPLTIQVWRRFKRDFALFLTGQFLFRKKRIPANSCRILYVYLGMPQLGDSIMDLSARTLWQHRGIKIDLFTHPNIASFYHKCPSFNQIIFNKHELEPIYDFIILQSYNWRCLKIKWRFYFTQPFLALHQYYYGPEFNRFEFSKQIWTKILDYDYRTNNVKPIFNLKLDHGLQLRDKNTIAIAVGGVTPWRTYNHWLDVVQFLRQSLPEYKFILIGSENGVYAAKNIVNFFSIKNLSSSIDDRVGKLTLDEVFKLLQRVSLLVSADGGLMHMGKAAHTPIVALLAGPIHPLMRFEQNDTAFVIHAENAVSDINHCNVAEVVLHALDSKSRSLQVVYTGMEPVLN